MANKKQKRFTLGNCFAIAKQLMEHKQLMDILSYLILLELEKNF